MTQTGEENPSDGRFGYWDFEIRACFGFRIFEFFLAPGFADEPRQL
jgi:hypothetical protein